MNQPARLDPDRATLVIVDIQGRLAEIMDQAASVQRETIRMIEGAGLFELPILWLEQLPDKLGPTVAPVAQALAGHEPIAKQTFSGMREPAFARALQGSGRSQVLLAGIESHVCVYQTGMDLLASGYQVFPLADCISARHTGNRQLGLDRLVGAGASLTSVEMALFELQGEASGERFRRMIQLVR